MKWLGVRKEKRQRKRGNMGQDKPQTKSRRKGKPSSTNEPPLKGKMKAERGGRKKCGIYDCSKEGTVECRKNSEQGRRRSRERAYRKTINRILVQGG